ncbi:stage II sporulation protein M [Paenibacillus silvae]|uniref:stage II sporulation protein M n=1 Tax=Paenibacillus silvae TaxID=1325358 RepID=UPI002005147E|nr:stage II sporulation protein M [Paenibacillus silvae]MCK6078730.1 stage II sporulation protein M [Paenibacillus silvae]MCK6153049.1 stage II sporulation protein M [Paenibacillus silvae]MCK6271559.1 stage II sporulation protein M [Paenibacillus silvae]
MLKFSTFMRDMSQIRTALIWAFLLFAVGIGAGWVSTGPLEQLMLNQIEGIRQVSQQLEQGGNVQWNFFLFIFFNNAIKSVLVIYAGIFFGILPIIFLLINGMVLGFVVHATMNNGASFFDIVIKGLLPHGIIEIPVIIIACAFGLKFGALTISSLAQLGGEKRALIGTRWREFVKTTLTASFWVVILLFIAAIIESTLTYALVRG